RTGNVYVAGDTAPHSTLTPSSLQLGPSDFPTVNPLMPGYTVGGYGLTAEGAGFFGKQGTANIFLPGVPADTFVSKFDSSLEKLDFSTYLGGRGHDVNPQIALDARGIIHEAGITAGFATGVELLPGSYAVYRPVGVTDDFPTLHANQAVFGGGQ